MRIANLNKFIASMATVAVLTTGVGYAAGYALAWLPLLGSPVQLAADKAAVAADHDHVHAVLGL